MDMKEQIINLLKDHNQSHVEQFASYIEKLQTEKHKKGEHAGKLKNPWALKVTAEKFADWFNRVHEHGLVFDGVHITLSNVGISFDYQAYKNKMLIKYPESKISLAVVYEGDSFSFSESDGKVSYTHEHKDPFKNDKEIIGAYCVVKNQRGEFLTMMGLDEIKKHRQAAKTQYIWKQWPKEMTLKTVIKKACKYHFNDVFQHVQEMDNVNYDLDLPLGVDPRIMEEIENIKTLQGLTEYYNRNKPKDPAILALLTKRKEQLQEAV